MTFPDTYKPKFADSDEPTLADFNTGSIGWLIQRVIEDISSQPDMKQIGGTHLYALHAMQRYPIAKRQAHTLKRGDIIEFCKWRRKTVCAATTNQTISYMSGVFKYASSAWDECENVANAVAAIEAARPFLVKHQLVGKSTPRKRRPTDEEIERLLNYYSGRRRQKIPMPELIAFSLISSRRISEICRITWGDVDFENKVYWVRDLKHPTKKKGNDKRFILFPEIEVIIRRQPRQGTDEKERVFPYNSKSASASYYEAKKALGIEGLRFHDNRRDAISKWLVRGMRPEEVRVCVSGHDTTRILESNYDGRDALELVSDMMQRFQQPAL